MGVKSYTWIFPIWGGSWGEPPKPLGLLNVQLYSIEEQAKIIQQFSVALELIPVIKVLFYSFTIFYHRFLHIHKIGLEFILNID